MHAKKVRSLGAAVVSAFWLALTLFAWFGPSQDISLTERRKLEPFPQLTTQTLMDGRFMTKFETYTQDQFPLRERFRQLKAVFSYSLLRKGDNNGIYLAQGYAAKLEYPLNEASVAGAIQKFQRIYDRYLQGGSGKRLFCVVPDKGYYLAAPNGYPAMDYDALFDTVAKIPWAEAVDIRDCLGIDCYYATDTHWRQETLLPAARKLAEALEIDGDENYLPTVLQRPFYGVYYGQAALPLAPDTMYLLENDILSGCTVTNHETGQQTQVYDRSKLESRDLYDVFLSGPVSALTVDNPAGPEGRELILFRDSFGSSLAPLLVSGYAKITLLDTRYVRTEDLGQFVDFGDQDVLFLYSPTVLNNSAMLK